MIRKSLTPDEAISFLNELTRIDAAAMEALVETRVACHQVMVDHPTVQIAVDDDGDGTIGFLGVLNGLFGIYEGGPKKGWGSICAVWEQDGSFSGFKKVPNDPDTVKPVGD